MIFTTDVNKFGVAKYTCLEEDIPTLLSDYIKGTQAQGSECEVLNLGVTYVYVIDVEGENYQIEGHWEIKPSSGGGTPPVVSCGLTLTSDKDATKIYEKGLDSFTANITAKMSKGSNNLTNLIWSSTPALTGFNTTDTDMSSMTKVKSTGVIDDTVTIKAKLSDAGGKTVEKSITYNFANPSYLVLTIPSGIDYTMIDDSNVESYLTGYTKKLVTDSNKTQTITWSGEDKRIAFCYPASKGNLTEIIQTDLGFNYISAYDKKTVNVPNANGDLVPYNLYVCNVESWGEYEFKLTWG